MKGKSKAGKYWEGGWAKLRRVGLGWFGDGGEQAYQRRAGLMRGVWGLCLAMVLWLAGASGVLAETQEGTEINTVHSSTADAYAWTPEVASDEAGIRIVGYDAAGNVGYDK
ncbi:MAG: hypothetical protein QME81_15720 [bacterium]|nr:hypothetical protein [bacterium]